MEDLEDELDLRYHRGLKPEVYYRIPTLEVRTIWRLAQQQLNCT
jgi:hypothetical protein